MIHRRIAQAFGAWQDRRASLQAQSQQLEAALQLYTLGTGPLPAELMDEVHTTRRECDGLFKEVLAAVRENSTGPSG